MNRNGHYVRVFAIYQILLGWKTYRYYYETGELPNPRPTQPEKNWVQAGILGHLFPQQIFFRGLGLILYRKQTNTRNPTQPNSPQTPCWIQRVLIFRDIVVINYWGVCGEFDWVRFLVASVSYLKTNPNPRKIICCGKTISCGKKWP